MKAFRLLVIATAAAVLMIGARPMAEDEQFPRGLMSSAPRVPGQGLSCTIQTRPLTFRPYDVLGDSLGVVAIGQVIYLCVEGGRGGAGTRASSDRGIRIEMTEGQNHAFVPRAMAGPTSDTLEYNLYLDSTFVTIWGDGAGRTEVYYDGSPPSGRPVIVPIFARIFGRQDVVAGTYHDEVLVRIVF